MVDLLCENAGWLSAISRGNHSFLTPLLYAKISYQSLFFRIFQPIFNAFTKNQAIEKLKTYGITIE